jgi:SOS response regulatory protein OraA/RecX
VPLVPLVFLYPTARIITDVDKVYAYALKLLKGHDISAAELRHRLRLKFGIPAEDTIQLLLEKNFLNDRRFAENYIARRKHRGKAVVSEELLAHGIPGPLILEMVARAEWPSLREAMEAKMKGLKLRAPLQPRDAARLFRALQRLGYEEDAVREEIENINAQQ